jgi:excisionase family DNA binding protein
MLIECSLEREQREVFSFLVMLCYRAATKIFLLGLLVPVVLCLQWSKRTYQIAQVFRKVLRAHLVSSKWERPCSSGITTRRSTFLQATTAPNPTCMRGYVCMPTGYLTVEQIAKELGLSVGTVLRWIRRKELKAYTFGKTYRVKSKDYQGFLHQRYTGKSDEEDEDS